MDKEFPEIKLAVLTAHTSPNLVDIRFKGLPSRVQYIVKADLHASNSFENILKNAFEQKTANTVTKAKPVDAIYLSNTQAELLKLIAQGLSNQAIADQRGTTLRAVEALINRTYQALKLNENDSMNLRVEAVKLWKSSKIHVK
jgi:DNA-binding NarL/FixJ family response regulator